MKNVIKDQVVLTGMQMDYFGPAQGLHPKGEIRRPTVLTQMIGHLNQSFATALVRKTNSSLFSRSTGEILDYGQRSLDDAKAILAQPQNSGYRLPTVSDLRSMR